jgi:hypothetical protein
MRVFRPETMPTTWGQAMLVPVMTTVAVLAPKALVETIPVPGAHMSIQSLLPVNEKLAMNTMTENMAGKKCKKEVTVENCDGTERCRLEKDELIQRKGTDTRGFERGIIYPKFDEGLRLSFMSRLPTAMTPGPAAGVTLQASVLPFPPATTTVIPA